MKAFDRYFLKIALVNLLLASVGVSALYVLIDYLYNIEKLADYPVADIAIYYSVNLPPILYLLGPLIALMGTSFGISRILKNREMLPLAAGGLRASRALRMFWVAGILAAVTLAALRIVGLPEIERMAQREGVVNLRKSFGDSVGLRDKEGNHWRIGSFDLVAGQVKDVEIVRYDDDGQVSTFESAAQLDYKDGAWQGERAVFLAGSFRDQDAAMLRQEASGKISYSSLVPSAISTRGVKRSYRSPRRLAAMLSELPHRIDLRVHLYKIFAWPFLAIGLVLGGGVISLRLNLRNAFFAVALTFALAFGGFALVMVLEKMVLKGSINAEIGIFGPPFALIVASLVGLRWYSD